MKRGLSPIATAGVLAIALAVNGAAKAEEPPPLPDPELEIVATLLQGPGNITVTPEGRIVISNHQFYEPEYRVLEVMPDGTTKPFPTEQWSRAPGDDGIGLNAVLGVRADPLGVVWMLDNGGDVPKVVGWNTRHERLERVIYIPAPVTRPGSFHNDLAVDTVNHALYIADIGGDRGPALVVVDLKTGLARRVLEGHPSVQAEDLPMVVEGREVTLGTGDQATPARVGVNPITIDDEHEWVYFGAMHGDELWRVPAKDLANPKLTPEELAALVERFGDKPVSDGISMDSDGNVYITDVENNAIGVTSPDGTYRIYAQNDYLLSWPDGISAGPHRWMYATVNQLHRSAVLNSGENESKSPYYVVRVRSLGRTVPGR